MNRALVATFAVLLATLLVGQRFGFVWAGGTGYVPNLDAVVEGTSYQRGETVSSGDQNVLLRIGSDTLIGMEANTELTLEQLQPGETVLYLHKGRIAVKNGNTVERLTVKTNYTESFMGQASEASFVNYDFKQTVSMIPMEKPLAVMVPKANQYFITPSPIEVLEMDPWTITDIDFNPNASASAQFYQWFGEQGTVDNGS